MLTDFIRIFHLVAEPSSITEQQSTDNQGKNNELFVFSWTALNFFMYLKKKFKVVSEDQEPKSENDSSKFIVKKFEKKKTWKISAQPEFLPTVSLPTIENDEEQDEEQDEEESGRKAEHHPPTTVTEQQSDFLLEKSEEDLAPRIPDSFYYDEEKIHAKPITKDERSFPINTLSM